MGLACIALVLFLCCSVSSLPESAVAEEESTELATDEQFDDRNDSERRSIENVDDEVSGRGRGKKSKKSFMRMLVSVKLMALSIIIPGLVAVLLYASWKGITLSLLAFTVAILVAVKNLSATKHGSEKSIHHHVVVEKTPPHHEHWYRKLGEYDDFYPSNEEYNPHRKKFSPYSGYYKH